LLQHVDLVLTDTGGVEKLPRKGLAMRGGELFGLSAGGISPRKSTNHTNEKMQEVLADLGRGA